ncbi:MAG: N-acetylmuramoyl-L-alanine amidase [Candidatus Erginobacter occultus]|nr:N-acetylmuramoyl-L-alanine amidase [Candidatus Erginobacter occultus]
MSSFRKNLRRRLLFRPSSVLLGCLLPILISGGLSVPAIILRGPVARIPVRSIRHQETLYIPVAAIARAYGLVLEAEDGRSFLFGSDRLRLRIEAGSREAELNGEKIILDHPVDWRDGTLIVPIYLALVNLPDLAPGEDLPPALAAPARTRIMLDPGHGGLDPGAVGEGLVQEKEIVLEIAQTARDILEADGCRVILTREDDRYLSLRNRARMANRLQVELFVSIHANAAHNQLALGTETFFYAPASSLWSRTVAGWENAVLKLETPAGPDYAGGPGEENSGDKRRRESVRAAAAVQKRLSAAAGTPDRGIKAAEFYVLKHTRMPSILIETGFLSNRLEREYLTDRRHRDAVAEAIARGIRDYLELRPR